MEMNVDDVSAKAGQYVVVTYNDNLPNRHVAKKGPNGYTSCWLREVTMPTEQAVELYNDLRHALFD